MMRSHEPSAATAATAIDSFSDGEAVSAGLLVEASEAGWMLSPVACFHWHQRKSLRGPYVDLDSRRRGDDLAKLVA